MTEIVCPALRSDDTLGFLAALGMLEVCTSMAGLPAQLGWEGVGGAAVIEVDVADRNALVEVLHASACDLDRNGKVVPVPDASLVTAPASDAERKLRKERGEHVEYDPLRLLADEAVERYRSTREREEQGDLDTSRWLVALVNQLAAERNGSARALTPLYSPSGRMSLHQLFRDALAGVVKDRERLRETLEGWRRVDGTGANLDARALRDAVVATDGKAANRAVPGATWLGLMAVPFFRQTGDGGRQAHAVGWDATARGGAILRWPVWRQPLDRDAVEVLLAHPAIGEATVELSGPADRRARKQVAARRRHGSLALQALGVEAICTSRRRPLNNSAGALLPPTVMPVPIMLQPPVFEEAQGEEEDR